MEPGDIEEKLDSEVSPGEPFREENREIAEQIINTFFKKGLEQNPNIDNSDNFTLEEGGKLGFVYYFKQNPDRPPWPKHLLDNSEFQFPAVAVEIDDLMEGQVVTSVHGRLSVFVVDKNDKLWMIYNIYLFNTEGQALKLEYLEETDFGMEDIDTVESHRINANLSKDDSRTVPLEPGDYEYVKSILKQVEMQ